VRLRGFGVQDDDEDHQAQEIIHFVLVLEILQVLAQPREHPLATTTCTSSK